MSFRVHPYFVLLYIACMACVCKPANAQYISQTESLTSGKAVTISAPKATHLVIVSHPGSAVSRKMEFNLHSSSYKWMPKRAGIYEISTPKGPTQVVSVQFGYFPIKGLIVLVIAFIVFFGGAGFASYNVFKKG